MYNVRFCKDLGFCLLLRAENRRMRNRVSSSSGRPPTRVVPANVARAANFYQPNGLLHGQPEIRAADSTRTRIIGNFRSDYTASSYNCEQYPLYGRVFAKTHTQIECD